MTQSSKPRFAPVLRALLDEDAQAMGHATPEQLIDHHAGRLPPEQADLLDRHLRGCQECAGLFRDLAEFEAFTPAPAAEALADREAQAAWRRLEGRLPQVKPLAEAKKSRLVPVSPPGPVERPRRSWWQRPEPAYALAAVLCIFVIGLSFSVRSLSRRLDELTKPRVNGGIATLYGEEDPTRGEEEKEVVDAPQGGGFLSLALHLSSSPYENYEAEVRSVDQSGRKLLWTISGLKLSKDHLSFDLGKSLQPGTYQIDLFGLRNGDRQLVNRYPFRIVSP